MPSCLRLLSCFCMFAVLVSAPVLAQSNQAFFAHPTNGLKVAQESNPGMPQTLSFAGHRARALKGTAALSSGSQTSGLSFESAMPYLSKGNGANAVAIADVNQDGILDLVVANLCTDSTCTASNVGVLLGNGDGTFQAAVGYDSGGLYADSVVVADLGNGTVDIVVANCGANSNANCVSASGNVAVLIGNGDGTFQAAVPYNLSGGGFGSTSVAVADVNGDGNPDLVVAAGCTGGGCVGVLLGNGDGTFQTELTPNPSGGIAALALAVADVNGDGKPDVVVANQCTDISCTSSSVGVLKGDGTGTFQAVVNYDSGGLFPDAVVIADLGNGKLDLVVANSSTSISLDAANLGVLLGNGDGTFQTAVVYPSGAFGAASLAVADVNGDGKPDAVVANCSSTASSCIGGGGTVGVLLGNGDGTFQTAVTYLSGGNTPFGVAVGDVNADGKPDIVAANCFSNRCAQANGNVGVLINNSKTETATALTSSKNPSDFGQSLTFTATVTAQPGFDKGTPTATVSFYDGTTKIGSSNLNGSGVATLMTSTLAVTTHNITATYSGDSNFATSTSPLLPQVVQGNASTTTLTTSSSTVAVGTSITLTAKVSSAAGTPPDGETVTFKDATGTLGTGPLSKGKAIFTSKTILAGAYSVVASYPGDATFLPSASTPQALDVQDFKLSANPTTVPVSGPGKGGSTTITITTYGNLKAQSLTNWTCSGLPSESNCTFGTVNSNDEVSLSIATTAASDLRWPLFGHHQGLFYAILLPGFLGVVSTAGRRRTLRGLRRLAWIVVLGLPALWLACGGGTTSVTPPPTGGTPPGSSTVTVSATSGTLQHSTSFKLTVQ